MWGPSDNEILVITVIVAAALIGVGLFAGWVFWAWGHPAAKLALGGAFALVAGIIIGAARRSRW